MKKFIKNYDFEDYFEPHILKRGEQYYNQNRIIDIWYRDNTVIAYIDGTEIYRVELEINAEDGSWFYCSCSYSEEGEFLCKHIAAILYYLKDNKIPELEKGGKIKHSILIYDHIN